MYYLCENYSKPVTAQVYALTVCVCVCVCARSVAQLYLTLGDPMDYSPHQAPWDFLGKKTGVGCHFLLQGIIPTQGQNLHLSCTGRKITTAPPGKPT